MKPGRASSPPQTSESKNTDSHEQLLRGLRASVLLRADDWTSYLMRLSEETQLALLATFQAARSVRAVRGIITRRAQQAGLDLSLADTDYLVGRWHRFYGHPPTRLPPDIEARLRARDGHCCQYCARRLRAAEVHHVIPRALGGSHDPCNLVLACPHCNRRIGDSIRLPRCWGALHSESRCPWPRSQGR